jgi:hypothetical protein
MIMIQSGLTHYPTTNHLYQSHSTMQDSFTPRFGGTLGTRVNNPYSWHMSVARLHPRKKVLCDELAGNKYLQTLRC